MKYCTRCGGELVDDAVVCIHCGCKVQKSSTNSELHDLLKILIKVFMILGCLSIGWLIIPLAWCIPMTVTVFNKLKSEESMSIGFKVCVLLFVSRVAGICLLCMDD